jgi:hypothetical protein
MADNHRCGATGQTGHVRTHLAIVSLLALTGCSSGSSQSSSAVVQVPSTLTSATGTVSVPSKPARALTAAPVAKATTTAAAPTFSAPPVAPLSTKAPGTVAAQKATAPGVYTSDESGTVTLGSPGKPQDASGTTTLTVDAVKDGVQHSTLHSDNTGDTDEDILVRSTGSYVASLKLTSPAFTKEFRPTPAT